MAVLGAGLLVVGSAHRGTIGRLAVRSVADRMLHGADCPVAVVPRGYDAPGRLANIGVAFVDSPEGRIALAAAAALARRTGADLDVVTAVPRLEPIGGSPSNGVHPPDIAAACESAERAAQAAVDELAGDLGATVKVVGEGPVDAFVRLARAWDLLVCGSRGYGPLRTVLLGSVSRSLSHDVRCPLVVLPRGVEPGLEALVSGDAVAA